MNELSMTSLVGQLICRLCNLSPEHLVIFTNTSPCPLTHCIHFVNNFLAMHLLNLIHIHPAPLAPTSKKKKGKLYNLLLEYSESPLLKVGDEKIMAHIFSSCHERLMNI